MKKTILLLGIAAMLFLACVVNAETITFPRVGLAIKAPNEFEKAPRFEGLINPNTSASVLLTQLPPGAPANFVDEFTRERLAERGVIEQSRRQVDLQGTKALLVEATQQAAGKEFGKWLMVFSRDDRAYVINATYPASDAGASDVIRAALESISFVTQMSAAELAEAIPFTINDVDGLLREAPNFQAGNIVMLTKNGNGEILSATDPLMVVAQSLDEPVRGDKAKFAKAVLLKTPNFSDIEFKQVKALDVNGLPAIEIKAEASDTKTAAAVSLYQLLVFSEDNSYLRAVGTTGKSSAKKYLPRFQEAARTIKLKPQAAGKLKAQATGRDQTKVIESLAEMQMFIRNGEVKEAQLIDAMQRKPDSSRYLENKVVRHQWRDENSQQLTVWLNNKTVNSSSLRENVSGDNTTIEGCYRFRDIRDDGETLINVLIKPTGTVRFSQTMIIPRVSNTQTWEGQFVSTPTQLTLVPAKFSKKDSVTMVWQDQATLSYLSQTLKKADLRMCG